MQQLKVAMLTAFSHLSRLLVNLYIIKQIAMTQGPEGLGLLGNFMTLVTIAATLAGGGISAGIIKYISEYTGSLYRQFRFAGSAFLFTTFCALLTLLLGLLFSKQLTAYVFLNQDYRGYIYFFLLAQIFISFNNYAYGLTNGFRNNTAYAVLVIVGNLLAAILASYLIPRYGFLGAIVAITAPILCPFIPVIYYALSKRFWRYLRFDSVKQDSVLLSKFSLMLLFSTVCFPIVEMYIRNKIIHLMGIETAGFWQAITKLSAAYLSFYSLFLSFYFVPIVSPKQDNQSLVREVNKMILFIGGLFLAMMIFFFYCKNLIITLVYTDKFLAINHLFLWQMLGDFFRVIGWVVGFVVVAKAATKLYILGEILQGALFILLCTIELHYSASLSAVILSYVGTAFLYCVMVLTLFYYFFRNKRATLVMEM
ncbi:O-antigen translocase [Legionella jamestowniensis]|uniref:Lipopolysaccharide biosynthesis protein n=1 Tax=Legionella jamestowniensis TaxID=455 RepID=A0A0W0UFY8_9GAMM|nr:O-antigen translocase [Legionella jamestowniensis]KTD06804.1 lipopolysaccharide biosynthesis protein [Legionella jamestowniensis]SFL83005.1 antigen flippase [Legionella jamestowniensis DSM 19215]